MAAKTNRTVVRNQAYRGGEFNVRERHNERKNECYGNGDIDLDRADLNIHFRRVLSPDGTPETYEQTFNRLLSERVIVKRGLKPDAKVFDELIFDVNSAYFENHGGYDYAKLFFEEAYRCAVQEVGGEQYVLSAVMHADEKNKALSDQLGRDVYHYHLHVVYVPVVRKEIYFKKNNKDPELAGKLKEVIAQISHSKKWPGRVPVERDGKTILLNSYSLLQDRFFEHMRAADYEGFERGERGSTAEHLSDLEYKTKMEREQLAEAVAAADEKRKEVVTLDDQIEQKQKQVAAVDKRLAIQKKSEGDITALDSFGKSKNLIGQIVVSPEEVKHIKRLAHEGAASRSEIYDLKFALNRVNHELAAMTKDRDTWKARYQGLLSKVGLFLNAVKRAPRRVAEFLASVMREPPERAEPERVRRISRTQTR